jgi:subtilisin family serine protease
MSIGVAIVDSGVHPGHPHVRDVVAGRSFVPGEDPEQYLDYLGHGTAVAGAICEKGAPLRLYVAKVFQRRLVTSIEVLLAALDWSLEQPVAFVNLSLATQNEAHREAFARRVAVAAERGIRIVSPKEGLPGSLPGVVGVTIDDTLPRDRYSAEFAACGWPRPIPGQPQERNLYGISFAVANVTGCLARDLAG